MLAGSRGLTIRYRLNKRDVEAGFLQTSLTYAFASRSRIRSAFIIRKCGRAQLTRCRANSTASDQHSFYSVLEVTQDATLAEIKTAFRRLAKRWHPDHTPGALAKSQYQVRPTCSMLSELDFPKLTTAYFLVRPLEMRMRCSAITLPVVITTCTGSKD